MPAISRRLAQGATVATALVALWLTMMLIGAGTVDRTILHLFYAGDRPLQAEAARAITLLGDGRWVTLVVVAAGLWLLWRSRPGTAAILVLGTLLGRGITEIQKIQIGRLRPDDGLHLAETLSLSYPSGHSANAMMTYLSLALLLPAVRRKRWIAAALALAVLVGLSRVMLGVHWPSDVVGGWTYGALWTLLLVTVDQTLKRNSRTSPS
jgi:membrane-associated phospholipid phosphatase